MNEIQAFEWIQEEKTKLKNRKMELRALESRLFANHKVNIRRWEHLIKKHQGANMNPHGIFIKDHCKINIGLHTNSGWYYDATVHCGDIKNENMKCKSCVLFQTFSDSIEPKKSFTLYYLQYFAVHGFAFHGWNSIDMKKGPFLQFIQYDTAMCACEFDESDEGF